MKKEEALELLGEYDHVGKTIISSLYKDEEDIPDHVVKGLINEHERSFQPRQNYIMGSSKFIEHIEKKGR